MTNTMDDDSPSTKKEKVNIMIEFEIWFMIKSDLKLGLTFDINPKTQLFFSTPLVLLLGLSRTGACIVFHFLAKRTRPRLHFPPTIQIQQPSTFH